MLSGIRRFDVQARYAAVLSLAAILPCGLALALALRNFDSTLGRIIYGAHGRFLPAFAVCVLLSAGPAATGFLLGLNSAGQRRNERSGQSWLAFFVGGGILTLDLILLIAFYMLRLERPV